MPPITRRALLAQAGLASAAAFLPRAVNAQPLRLPPGLQLWSVKEELARDFEGTLRALGAMGYKNVEAAGWQGRTPRQFRDAVRDAGLDCVSCHYGLSDLIDNSEDRLAFARDVGVRYVLASSPAPSRPIDQSKDWAHAIAEAMTLADWRSNAEAMDRIGRRAREMGLRFGYHNHSAELLAYEGRLPMDEIVRLTDPDHVVLELDIGWVAGAGYDPAEAVRRYGPRIHLFHIKDLRTTERVPGQIVTDEQTVPIGSGTIDWPAVFAAARAAPLSNWFVELEPPFETPVLDGLRQSLAYLKGISEA